MGTGPVVGPPAFISVPELGSGSGSGAGVLGADEGVLGAGDGVLGGVAGVFGGGLCAFRGRDLLTLPLAEVRGCAWVATLTLFHGYGVVETTGNNI